MDGICLVRIFSTPNRTAHNAANGKPLISTVIRRGISHPPQIWDGLIAKPWAAKGFSSQHEIEADDLVAICMPLETAEPVRPGQSGASLP
jgi:hypothetical protein